jgi:hypothetical protein
MPDDITPSGAWRQQLNIKLDPQSVRELRALSKLTSEQYSPLIRRLLHQEWERLLAEHGPAVEEASQ